MNRFKCLSCKNMYIEKQIKEKRVMKCKEKLSIVGTKKYCEDYSVLEVNKCKFYKKEEILSIIY